MESKKNVSLIVGIAIPILMICLIAVSIYLPLLFAPAPQFNFLYVAGDSYSHYGVKNGSLVKNEVKYPEHRTPINPRSPDGYEVVYGSSDYGFFPFFFSGGDDYDAMYLKGHSTSKKLELQSSNDRRYYYRNRHFLGWIR